MNISINESALSEERKQERQIESPGKKGNLNIKIESDGESALPSLRESKKTRQQSNHMLKSIEPLETEDFNDNFWSWLAKNERNEWKSIQMSFLLALLVSSVLSLVSSFGFINLVSVILLSAFIWMSVAREHPVVSSLFVSNSLLGLAVLNLIWLFSLSTVLV